MLRIALAQCRQTADFDQNAATIFRFLDQAIAQKAHIVCFPEAQTFGYRADISDAHAPSPTEQLAELHAEVARRCGTAQMACILGTEMPSPSGKPHNSALVIDETGQILGELPERSVVRTVQDLHFDLLAGPMPFCFCSDKEGLHWEPLYFTH